MSKFTARIAHFCELARRGASPAASTGERNCHKLAAALHSIGDDMMLLDSDTLQGFTDLAHLTLGPFATDDEKSLVYQTLAKAAGK